MTLPTIRPRPAAGDRISRCLPYLVGAALVVLLGSVAVSYDGRGPLLVMAPMPSGSNANRGRTTPKSSPAEDAGGTSAGDQITEAARSLSAASSWDQTEVAYRPGGTLIDLPPSLRAQQQPPSSSVGPSMRVFQPRRGEVDHRRMAALILAGPPPSAGGVAIEHVAATAEEQRRYLAENGSKCHGKSNAADDNSNNDNDSSKSKNKVLEAYDALLATAQGRHLATELWKYCALTVEGGAYVDSGADAALLATFRDAFLTDFAEDGARDESGVLPVRNVAILGDSGVTFTEGTVHGSLLVLNRSQSPVPRGMVKNMVETSAEELAADPTALSRTLHRLVAQDISGKTGAAQKSKGLTSGDHGSWRLLQHRCHVGHQSDMMAAVASESAEPDALAVAHRCPKQSGFCCDVTDPTIDSVVMVTRHPLSPFQLLPIGMEAHPKPYRWDKLGDEGKGKGEVGENAVANAPFIATIREEVMERPKEMAQTPNFFEILLANDCLPTDKKCSLCLKNKAGATCENCLEACPCYCKSLCNTPVEEKFVSKKIAVIPPVYRKDPTRLVPRIIHQTWFEEVTKEKYPNMSRLIESWKRSGFEYRFYSDEAASEYLSLHFPSEVREAYDTILPGAFKADLFRYCALLIEGGVYADMDVLLETNLDAAIPGDLGFMTPVDEPGMSAGHRMCLWNGFIASAPGHPFLARVIENVVNNARNRFTSVDVDNSLCPNPELSVAHSFDILFTAGPCMLGKSINELLDRHPQTSFEAGTINIWGGDDGTGTAKDTSSSDLRHTIPGRSIILKQDKWDMGAHRFTWEEENLVIAATDMPDYDDRDKIEGNAHYSDTHVKFGVYGLDKLYTDRKIKNEKISISVAKGAVSTTPTKENSALQ